MPTPVYKADVLIIGAGLAGMCAALELLDQGFNVLMIDRDESSALGGLARWSFGGIFLVNTREQRLGRIRDSTELAYQDWVRAGEITDDDPLARDWARAYVEHCGIAVERWLRKRSVHFFPVVHWLERGLERPGNSVPRFHMVWGTGQRLIELLEARLMGQEYSKRLAIKHCHRVDGIATTDGRAAGAYGVVEPQGTEFRAEAESVIIASGGYCGSDKWLRTHWDAELGPTPEVILNGSHKFATGVMHRAAESAGGEVVNPHLSWMYAAGISHPSPRHPDHGLSIVPPRSALWLNKFGQRIGPPPLVSGLDTRHLVASVCRSPGGYSWQLMNWRIACKELAVSGSEYNDAIRDRKLFSFIKAAVFGNETLVKRLVEESEDFIVADTIDELVTAMNACTGSRDIDPTELRKTIEDYDSRVIDDGDGSSDEQLDRIKEMRKYRGDRARICSSQRIMAPGGMPLVAIREFILSRKSLGGIRTDLGSRVLFRRTGEEPGGNSIRAIPGLYAVGEAAGFGGGGIHGKRSLEGTFLGTCIYTGRVAAWSIKGGG